jgi:galactose mutarotase-like enzyme
VTSRPTRTESDAVQVVQGDGLTAAVAGRGGKVTSLRDARGHEWLLPPRAERPGLAGVAFVDAEMGGWDECAPSIVACTAPTGEHVPDHGDLWDAEWVFENDAAGAGDTGAGGTGGWTAYGSSLSYHLNRRIVPASGGLRFEYRVTSRRTAPMPFLWAAHPQLLAPAGSHLVVRCGRVVEVLDRPGARSAWTPELATIDTVPVGGCRKVYADPDAPVDSVTLAAPGAGELTLRWDPVVTPYVGLWFDRGAYAREPVIAIEPSTGFYDSLATAVGNGRVLWVESGRPVSWWVEVTTA